MWAMMPKFRRRSRVTPYGRGGYRAGPRGGRKKGPLGGGPFVVSSENRTVLVGQVGERLVGVGHLVDFLALLHGLALAAERGIELVGQAQVHRAALLAARGAEQPAV